MMTDTLITFETAVLAKEKGFSIISRFGMEASLYNKDGSPIYYANYGFMGSGLSGGYIAAPTQSLLCRWLRETHKKHIVIQPSLDEWVYCIQHSGGTKWGQDSELSLLQFNTYEDAMESALVDALGMIE